MFHPYRTSGIARRATVAALCGALTLSASPIAALAEPSSEEIAQEREGVEAQLAEAQERLSQLEEEIASAQEELEEAEARLDETRDKVDATRVQIDEATQRLDEMRVTLGGHMRDSYKTGNVSLASMLLAATSFEDLVSRIHYLDKVSEARAAEIDEITRLREELAEQERELEEAQAAQEEDVAAVEARTAEYEDSIAEAQAYYDGLDAEVQELIAREEAAREAEEEAARIAAEQAAAAAAAAAGEGGETGADAGADAAAGTTEAPTPEEAPSPAPVYDSSWNFDAVSSSAAGSGTFEQSTAALIKFDTASYTTVANGYYGLQTSTNYQHMGNYNSYKQRLTYSSGDMRLEFETLVQLPVTYNYSGDLGNPQGLCISPDGSYAYACYPDGHGHSYTQQGHIVRYDLARLRELGATEGDMSAFATGTRLGDATWRSCVKVGPSINMGHGQCVAIDPSTGELWMSTRGAAEYSDLTLIDTDSLTPVRQIRFHTGGTEFGSVLAFDGQGNFYYVKRSYSTWGSSPAGALRIYQGHISPNRDKVLIRLLPQSVKYPAGTVLQGVGVDPTANTLYVVNDSALLSVRLGPLTSGSLSAGDVHTEFLSPFREYEGMAFDVYGNGYLLVNRQAEIMRIK